FLGDALIEHDQLVVDGNRPRTDPDDQDRDDDQDDEERARHGRDDYILGARGARGAPRCGRVGSGRSARVVKEAHTDTQEQLPEYHVKARNTSSSSENKIHDEQIARQYGFRGALVPGVTVYAYLTHPLVEAFGAAWLERGTANVRFAKPIHD